MKRHSADLHSAIPATRSYSHHPRASVWISVHSGIVGFLLACLICSLFVKLMGIISFDLKAGIWPLFGG